MSLPWERRLGGSSFDGLNQTDLFDKVEPRGQNPYQDPTAPRVTTTRLGRYPSRTFLDRVEEEREGRGIPASPFNSGW